MNYKGIYFNDDPNSKFTCPETGAHFQFRDMCQRLQQVLKWRKAMEKQIHNQLVLKQRQEMTEDRVPSKDREAQLRREKEEFMKKMGIAKQKNEKQESRDKKFNNRIVVGAPAGPDGAR